MSVDLYEILEVESSASGIEIKRSYRKLALRYHPDKVGEDEREEAEIKFKEISHAYEILSDEAARLHYDLYGTTDGDGADMGGFDHNPFAGYGSQDYGADDFYNFFNNMNGGPPGASQQRQRANKTEDAELEVSVTLEDLYNGKVVKITSTRNIICPSCDGSGSKKKAVTKVCAACRGEGYTTKIKRVGPGLVSQFHVDCEACEGTGKITRSKDKCKQCLGKKVIEESKILEFEIAPGSKSGESIVLAGESDQYPGKKTGDVILTFHAKEHAYFTRKDDDLYLKYKILLVEALSGFSKVVAKHLDGRGFHITTPKGKVIRPGDYLCISGEGMPVKNLAGWFRSSSKRGDLYVEMEIEFPKDNWYLEKNDLVALANLLPANLSDKQEAEKQNFLGDSLPEANVEYVTNFTLKQKTALPTYANAEPQPQHEFNGSHDTAPECTTQ